MTTPLREDVVVTLAPDDAAVESIKRVLSALADEMSSSATGVIEDADPRYLHRFRIAVRRSRTIFSELKSSLEADALSRFRPDLKWIARLTSPVRDIDVFVMRLETVDLHSGDRHQYDRLRDLVARDRGESYGQLESALTSERYRIFRSDWTAFLQPFSKRKNLTEDRPIQSVASAAIRKAFGRVERQASALLSGDRMPDPELHRLRVSCKKVRYLVEAFGSLYDPTEIEGTLAHLRGLQDVLGNYNDAVLQIARVDRYRQTPNNGVTGKADSIVHRLEHVLQLDADRCRSEFVTLMNEFLDPQNLEQIDNTFFVSEEPLDKE